MMSKKTKILMFAAIAIGVIAAGVGTVYAATGGNGRPNFMSNLVNAIAQKFNLDADEVQQVFDDQMTQQKEQMDLQRNQTEAERQQSFTDRLNNAVTNGDLTQEQADKILAEKENIDSQITALNDKTGEERQEAMKQIMDEVKQWATDNDIPQQYLMFGCGESGPMEKGQGGPETGFRGHNRPAIPSTATQE